MPGERLPARVAVDATTLVGHPTGVGVAVAGLVAALRDCPDVDVVPYGLTWRGRRALEAALPAGMDPPRRPMAASVLLRLWAATDAAPIEWWTGAVDVVHGTNFVVPPARRAARLVTVHDLSAVRFPQTCTATSLRYPALVRRAIAAGAWVHTPSRFVAGEVVDVFGASPEQVRAVPWGVDVAGGPWAGEGAGGPGAGRSGPGRPGAGRLGPGRPGAGRLAAGAAGAALPAGAGHRPYVLGLGTAEPRKDFPSLVKAFDAVAAARPDLELRLVGPPGWGEAPLAAAVAAAHHRDRIVRAGWVGDRLQAIAGAAVLAYPSIYEGFGFPPLEAMALGVPVVATAAGAVPEVVGDAALVVPVGDADALGAAIGRVLGDDATRRRLVDAGRRRAALFTWQATAAGLAAVYTGLAADRS